MPASVFALRNEAHVACGFKILTLLFFTVGVIAFATGARLAFRNYQLLAHAVQLPGSVVELVGDSSASYPIVEYINPDGKRSRIRGWTSSPPSFSKGEAVTVLYDPGSTGSPRSAHISTFWELWGTSLFALFSGAVAGGLPLMLWLADSITRQ